MEQILPMYSAEDCYKRGLAALSRRRPQEANTLFESAMKAERDNGVTRSQMLYLSYFGLSLAKAKRPTREAIGACETAARKTHNPTLFLNLGKVYMMAGKRTKALGAFEKGLRIAPSHKLLMTLLAKVDRRSSPPISWLRRSHPINRWMGIMRAGLLRERMVPQKKAV